MGRFKDKQNQRALTEMLTKEADNDKLDSLKELLDEEKLNAAIDARIEAALGNDGAINSAIDTAVEAGITEAIAGGGVIETWADGRYEAKATV